MAKVKVKKLFESAQVPTKGNPTDAGYDLYSSEKVKRNMDNEIITKLEKDQADYIGVNEAGPFKSDSYRY